jgi:hypothetical protein
MKNQDVEQPRKMPRIPIDLLAFLIKKIFQTKTTMRAIVPDALSMHYCILCLEK